MILGYSLKNTGFAMGIRQPLSASEYAYSIPDLLATPNKFEGMPIYVEYNHSLTVDAMTADPELTLEDAIEQNVTGKWYELIPREQIDPVPDLASWGADFSHFKRSGNAQIDTSLFITTEQFLPLYSDIQANIESLSQTGANHETRITSLETPTVTTVSNLQFMASSNTLKPLRWYRFTHRTREYVKNTTELWEGEEEDIYIQAATSDSFFTECVSAKYPDEVIEYDLYDNTSPDGSSRPWGRIIRRFDKARRNGAGYDFRNVLTRYFRWDAALHVQANTYPFMHVVKVNTAYTATNPHNYLLYLSIKAVPANTPIGDTNYWKAFGSFSEFTYFVASPEIEDWPYTGLTLKADTYADYYTYSPKSYFRTQLNGAAFIYSSYYSGIDAGGYSMWQGTDNFVEDGATVVIAPESYYSGAVTNNYFRVGVEQAMFYGDVSGFNSDYTYNLLSFGGFYNNKAENFYQCTNMGTLRAFVNQGEVGYMLTYGNVVGVEMQGWYDYPFVLANVSGKSYRTYNDSANLVYSEFDVDGKWTGYNWDGTVFAEPVSGGGVQEYIAQFNKDLIPFSVQSLVGRKQITKETIPIKVTLIYYLTSTDEGVTWVPRADLAAVNVWAAATVSDTTKWLIKRVPVYNSSYSGDCYLNAEITPIPA